MNSVRSVDLETPLLRVYSLILLFVSRSPLCTKSHSSTQSQHVHPVPVASVGSLRGFAVNMFCSLIGMLQTKHYYCYNIYIYIYTLLGHGLGNVPILQHLLYAPDHQAQKALTEETETWLALARGSRLEDPRPDTTCNQLHGVPMKNSF